MTLSTAKYPVILPISRVAAAVFLALPLWLQAQTLPATAQDGTSGTTLIGDLSAIPAPNLAVKAWLTLDANSGQVIASEGIDERVEPASLTKIMTAYLVFEALEAGRLKLDQEVPVSEQAWRTGGSRMFIKPDTQVTVDELLQGVIVQSGNDASVALAEAVAGSEESFAALMNEKAAQLGLRATHYVNSTGLPDPEHLTSVRDLSTLAARLVVEFPQYLHYYSQKDYTYNNIKQPNRNRLLWLDNSVDGLKTGHTNSAGYCLVSTANRDGRRIIAVVVGAANDAARVESSLKLLNWSFQNFETVKLYDAQQPAVEARVWEGEVETVGLGSPEPVWVTVPRGKSAQVQPVASYTQPLMAPLTKGTTVGTLSLSLEGNTLLETPLVVSNDVPQAGFFGRMVDKVRLMFN
ncbi:D-alanyl-D-alanine carboxypeptidase family protein [Alcaligenes endophyticus]|uniref:serine-type D-Ala-D-Ala carboxypeptidase n=1 Tax=Alcaligenes endophyticus TaxID=1929088 RepID=A0ABT8EEF8_9BURK|nr:D-alanyl-D-alanine carboxypeptidase family protein [Alcaligenes endophyticus]MCX5592225.1 D-alanyl-D-alanine carboxypeptidase [Alcaligenes endophyticus]MDN4119667.1 D-alanyl-D-alanine carboxypeptidase [Alcaligenes endophyticus]